MSKVLPERIDIARLADTSATLEGHVPIARFGRLTGLLASPEGVVEVRLGFRREGGREVVRGRIAATLTLVCQRCLGGVEQGVDAEVDLVRVASEDEAATQDDGHDPFVAPNREAALAELVEDELLLALPLVPVHPEGSACADRAASAEVAGPRTESPFAALAALKKN